jgi:hypothetical protein
VPSFAQEGSGLEQVQSAWPHILRQIRARNVAVEALLKVCEPTGVDDRRVTLSFQYSFHRDKVEEQANRALIEEVMDALLGGPHSIHCVLGGESQADGTPSPRGTTADTTGTESRPLRPTGVRKAGAADGRQDQERSVDEDKLAAVADDPVVQAMVNQYGAKVVDVQ